MPPVHTTRHHRPPAQDREHVLDRHQERLVHVPNRKRNVVVDRRHQLVDARRIRFVALQSLQRGAPNHRKVVPGKLIRRQKLPNLQLHQVQKLLVVHHVHLVHEHDQRRNPNLTSQKNVLPCLRHHPIGRRHHQNRTVHLRRTRDHVLDVVRMTRAVHVRVVPIGRRVLHVRRRDRDPALPFLGRVVDRVERTNRVLRIVFRQHRRDRRRQRRLPVVDVPDRPDVHMRFRPVELFLRHVSARSRNEDLRPYAPPPATPAVPAAFRHWRPSIA